ncbi:PH domain-containing protein [Sphingobacterium bovistauri]|uniref:PH domain-containing protein n=1 Tax=Sphingobacterium bovistauri TaxID=2781959 RepID=A0ABS7Z4U5_9SPHI|nr:PH domain-containing protein [Sphingobacterium bovistauri]MCA5005167.1 PH domain-containing protein [Sphingobacterium bovistauri]
MYDQNLFRFPQRLNSLGYILNIVKTFVLIIRQFFFFILYLLYKYWNNLDGLYIALFFIALVLLTVVIAFINFKTFKFYLDEDSEEFVVQKGLFNKSKIVIKFVNILQVNVTQNMLQKALSLYSLTLDTAGSDKVEVDLYALDGGTAKELKNILLSKIDKAYTLNGGDSIVSEPQLDRVLTIPSRNILLVSLFSNYRQGLALFLAFLVSIYQHIQDVFETFEFEEENLDAEAMRIFVLESLFTMIAIVVLGLLSIPFIINIFRYYIKYYNFTIIKNTVGNFSMQYGLIKKVNTIFNSKKIQQVVFKQNQILKRLNIGVLSLKQLTTDQSKADRSSVEMPGVSIIDRDTVYALAFGSNVFDKTTCIKPKNGLLTSRMIKMVFFYMMFLSVVIILDYLTFWLISVLCVALLLNTLYNYLFYRNYTLLYMDNFLIKRYGVWNEKEIIIPMQKMQSISISKTFFQNYSHTSNLHVSTAAGTVSFRFFDERDIHNLANYLLYTVEK